MHSLWLRRAWACLHGRAALLYALLSLQQPKNPPMRVPLGAVTRVATSELSPRSCFLRALFNDRCAGLTFALFSLSTACPVHCGLGECHPLCCAGPWCDGPLGALPRRPQTTEKAIVRKEKHLDESEASDDEEVIYKVEVPANR